MPAGSPHPLRRPELRAEVVTAGGALALLDGELGDLGSRAASPFLTREWLRAWWEVFGTGEATAITVRDGETLTAGAFCQRGRAAVAATANDHSGDWDVIGADAHARERAWAEIARLPALRIRLRAVPEWTGSADAAARALSTAGLRVVRERGPLSPYLPLPSGWEALMASVSRNLRSQLGRRRRALEREGRLVFRTSRSERDVARDLDALLAVEASGWKARTGTAIATDARARRFYREYALAAARAGSVRLHVLEVDDAAVAADLAAVAGDVEFLVKTGFDESWSRLSPGLVLRGEVLRQAVEAGLSGYDFLGGPDPYKMRWTGTVRARATVIGYRDPPGYWYRSRIRPALKRLRDRARSGSASGTRGARAARVTPARARAR